MGLIKKKRKAGVAVEQRPAGIETIVQQPTEAEAVRPRPIVMKPDNSWATKLQAARSRFAETQPAAEAQPAAGAQPSPGAQPAPAAVAPAAQQTPQAQPASARTAPARPAPAAQPATEQAKVESSLDSVVVTQPRDLSRLSREDLLQLLLAQSKEAERLQDYLREVADEFERCTSSNERLREKLDAKDEQLERQR